MMVMVMVTPFSNSSATQKGSGREGFLWIYTKIATILLITFCKAEFQLFNRSFSQLTFFFFIKSTACCILRFSFKTEYKSTVVLCSLVFYRIKTKHVAVDAGGVHP